MYSLLRHYKSQHVLTVLRLAVSQLLEGHSLQITSLYCTILCSAGHTRVEFNSWGRGAQLNQPFTLGSSIFLRWLPTDYYWLWLTKRQRTFGLVFGKLYTRRVSCLCLLGIHWLSFQPLCWSLIEGMLSDKCWGPLPVSWCVTGHADCSLLPSFPISPSANCGYLVANTVLLAVIFRLGALGIHCIREMWAITVRYYWAQSENVICYMHFHETSYVYTEIIELISMLHHKLSHLVN